MIERWTMLMFAVAVAGSMAGLLWPIMIVVWRKETSRVYGAAGPAGAGRAARSTPQVFFRWFRTIVVLAVLPFVRIGLRIVWLTLLAIAIATVAAAVGFAAFLNDPAVQASLQQNDALAYFTSFNYGFAAASLIEEALRTPSAGVGARVPAAEGT